MKMESTEKNMKALKKELNENAKKIVRMETELKGQKKAGTKSSCWRRQAAWKVVRGLFMRERMPFILVEENMEPEHMQGFSRKRYAWLFVMHIYMEEKCI